MTEAFEFTAGTAPLLVSMPHVGTYLPPALAARMTDAGKGIADTDWHVDRLYDFLGELGASMIAATHSRYVIDLNRSPDGQPLYPGASETQLCPLSSFADEPLYHDGKAPDDEGVAERRERIWQPYHEKLRQELSAIRERCGIALLWDAHSIRSRVPRFFEGQLPDLNFGTASGSTADPSLIRSLTEEAEATNGFSWVFDGRFKGGFITRRYGAPQDRVHAVQLELSQIIYMDEDPPYSFREDRAAILRPVLRRLLHRALAWAAEART